MLGTVFKASFKDFLRPNRLVVWIGVGLITALVGFAWEKYTVSHSTIIYNQVFDLFVLRIVALASAIFTTMVISQEVDQKTITYLLTRSIPRKTLLLGRFLASWLITALLCTIATLLAAVFILRSDIGQAGIAKDLALVVIGTGAYGAFFLFLSLILNRAMIYCLLFAFGWETLVPNMPGDMRFLSLYSYLQAAGQESVRAARSTLVNALTGGLERPVVSASAGWIILGSIILGFLILSSYWFSRFEYSPREEAD